MDEMAYAQIEKSKRVVESTLHLDERPIIYLYLQGWMAKFSWYLCKVRIHSKKCFYSELFYCMKLDDCRWFNYENDIRVPELV